MHRAAFDVPRCDVRLWGSNLIAQGWLPARAPARVESRQNVWKAQIGPNGLEIRQPTVEKGKQHVTGLDGRLTVADGRILIVRGSAQPASTKGGTYSLVPASQDCVVDASRQLRAARACVRRGQPGSPPNCDQTQPTAARHRDRLVVLVVPVEANPSSNRATKDSGSC